MCKGDEILCNKERKKKMFHLSATMFRFALARTNRNAMIWEMAMESETLLNHKSPLSADLLLSRRGSLTRALWNPSRIEPQASLRSASSSKNEWNLTLVKKLPLVRDLQSMKVSSKKTTDGEIHLNLIGRLITSPCMLRQHKNKLSIIKEKRQEEEKVELGR